MGQTTSNTVHFMAIGDWGLDTDEQKQIGEEMAKISQSHNKTKGELFVAALGDNFYEDGVKSVDDPRWDSVFVAPFAKVNCPWYPVLGNHDWEGNVQAQIDYAKDPRWKMAGAYYVKSFAEVDMFFIDTTLLCPELSFMFTGSEFSPVAQKKHFEWLEQVLKKSCESKKLKWRIVFGHYPVYSGGSSGILSEMQVVNELFIKYEVDAYFCGHDHSLQHLQCMQSGISYFVSGSGCEITYVRAIPNYTVFQSLNCGFMSCTIGPRAKRDEDASTASMTTDRTSSGSRSRSRSGTEHVDDIVLTVRFISHKGEMLYQVEVPRRTDCEYCN